MSRPRNTQRRRVRGFTIEPELCDWLDSLTVHSLSDIVNIAVKKLMIEQKMKEPEEIQKRLKEIEQLRIDLISEKSELEARLEKLNVVYKIDDNKIDTIITEVSHERPEKQEPERNNGSDKTERREGGNKQSAGEYTDQVGSDGR